MLSVGAGDSLGLVVSGASNGGLICPEMRPVPPPQPGTGNQGHLGRPRHLPENNTQMKPGWAVGLLVGPDGRGARLDRAGLWRTGAQPCCVLTRAGAGKPGADVVHWAWAGLGNPEVWQCPQGPEMLHTISKASRAD